MRRVIVFAGSAFLLVLLGRGTTCLAQGELPYGTYRQTCRNISYNGTRLSAKCQKVDGGWRNTSLDYRNCQGGQVINENGNLRCGGEGGYAGGYGRPGYAGGWQGGLPPGDYKRTCQNMRVEGDRLYANCQRTNGSWNDTSLNVNQCGGPIVNDNGNLRCGGNGYGRPGYAGGWQGGLPPGDYTRTCKNMRVEGDRLYATCQRVNRSWNDTSLKNFTQCRSPIVNDNGNLRCPK